MTAQMEPRLTPVIDVKEIEGMSLVVAEIPELGAQRTDLDQELVR